FCYLKIGFKKLLYLSKILKYEAGFPPEICKFIDEQKVDNPIGLANPY
ncbi:MAG: hypothetical protein JHC26_10775, partial [Thermofilum sp.]|nr:hypothetical protein [Thermofilum sp.]